MPAPDDNIPSPAQTSNPAEISKILSTEDKLKTAVAETKAANNALERVIYDHKQNGCNDLLDIEAIDEPGSGGAHHHYVIVHPMPGRPGARVGHDIRFQNGPIKEAGVNGVTHESLIAIILHRLRSFQNGPFGTRDNAIAITHLEEALLRLQKRTADRLRRGVEGTHQK